MGEVMQRLSNTRPSPFERGAGGERGGCSRGAKEVCSLVHRPHPNPLPKGEGTRHDRRSGAILVVVLVCLAVATVLAVVTVKQAVMEQRVTQANHARLQATWLAEAGIERAVARLAADAKYSGETWTIPAKELAADGSGVVRIQVESVADQPQRRSVRVEADYPDAPAQRCRQVKRIVLDRDAIQSPQSTKATN